MRYVKILDVDMHGDSIDRSRRKTRSLFVILYTIHFIRTLIIDIFVLCCVRRKVIECRSK